MKSIPDPLFRKILITAVTGCCCMIFGAAYFFAAKDGILLFLSAMLLTGCLWRAFSLYRIAAKESYELVEGTCVGVSAGLIGKLKTVRMMDDAGTETTLRLAKNCKFKIGDRYRLYFDNRSQYRSGSGFIDKALATGGFLGCEQIAAAAKDEYTDD